MARRGGKYCVECGRTVGRLHDHERDPGIEIEPGGVWVPDVVVTGSGPWDSGNHGDDGPGTKPRFIGWMSATGF